MLNPSAPADRSLLAAQPLPSSKTSSLHGLARSRRPPYADLGPDRRRPDIAHRFSTYKKRGTMHQEAIEGTGVISTQFLRTPGGWKMSSMAWDDERPGLTIPDRYR